MGLSQSLLKLPKYNVPAADVIFYLDTQTREEMTTKNNKIADYRIKV